MHTLVFLLWWSCCVSAREIIVSEKGNDTSSCLEERNSLVSCQSLVKVSEYVTSHKLNNVIIRINDTNYTLQGVANFSGVHNITITGMGHSLTQINCNSLNSSGAGMAFDNSSHIILKSFMICDCGATITNVNKHRKRFTGNGTAIQIIDCSQVTVLGIVVYRSISQGLTFINTGSTVQVIDSHFINNTINNSRSHWLGGGGLQVIFYKVENLIMNTNYIIANSVFKYNQASVLKDRVFHKRTEHSYSCERGGGIRVIFDNDACGNSSITLKNSTFEGNIASFGGGMLILLTRAMSNSSIKLWGNLFKGNTGLVGGGGLAVSTTTLSNLYPINNMIKILNTSFVNNLGLYGGGISIDGSCISKIEQFNSFDCVNCIFEENSAQIGAAVSVASTDKGSQFITDTCFTDSKFKNNIVIKYVSGILNGNQNGAFYITEVHVTFAGTTNFTGNNGTALYIESAGYSTKAKFEANSFVYFANNSGYQGGAIVLVGKSSLYSSDNCYYYFWNNTATTLGGAICALTNNHLISSIYFDSCFLQLQNYKGIHKNISYYFHNNRASFGYIDIYATSIDNCNFLCGNPLGKSFFDKDCYGNFTFTESVKSFNSTRHIVTAPKNFTIDFEGVVTPGIAAPLKIVQYDEVGGDVSHMFPITARIQSSSQNAAKVDPSYVVIHNNSIIILGFPNDEGELLLENSKFTLNVKFQLTDCNPGFVFNNQTLKCTCSNNDYLKVQCEANGSAAIASNYWAGYDSENVTQANLLTGLCITLLCNPTINCNNNNQLCSLPNARELEKHICGENRHKRLCGRCVTNKTVYYHSASYTCGHITYCQYGIPIYIATEILPVTIIFLVILLFNISLTSGALYSFVFYAQVLSRLIVSAFNIIHINHQHHLTKAIVDALQFVLGVFVFDIQGDRLGFCIFQTDSMMNLFMIKYATLAYAFLLVLATILIMRLHSCYSCVKLCRRCGRRNIRGSIVDGLSAFLVLCYFQCAVITSQILAPSQLYGIGRTWNTTVSLFDGELDYLKGDHLWYAVPALLCIIFILIPPPTILILEPILTKLFSMDFFANTPLNWYYNRLRLKLMPFLDSFQACFKDRHRYFAGFYFLYRLVFILIISIPFQDPRQFSIFSIYFFMFIIHLHVFLQPYKNKCHDRLEISLFVIIIISLLTITPSSHMLNGTALIIMQLLLISLSIGYIVVYITIKIYQKLAALRMKKETPVSRECIEVSNDSLPYRLLNDNNEVAISNSYRTF